MFAVRKLSLPPARCGAPSQAISEMLSRGWPVLATRMQQRNLLFLCPANFSCHNATKGIGSRHIANSAVRNARNTETEYPEVGSLKVAELKFWLRKLGLKTSGNKADLQERLSHATKVNQASQTHAGVASDSLPSASPEQQAVVDAIGSGRCVAVSAVAGAGKTTCILQAAAQLTQRKFLILTYNRALRENCLAQIDRLQLGPRVRAQTIHGFVTKCAGQICKDDKMLLSITEEWAADVRMCDVPDFDVLIVDEAQDLRPSFCRAIACILRARELEASAALQMVVIGDPKQLLYDFPTYGDDKAQAVYLADPEAHWAEFTKPRAWVHASLSVSYRLTPNIAAFLNCFWGTRIIGGNTTSPNLPVDYLCRVPYPACASTPARILEKEEAARMLEEEEAAEPLKLPVSLIKDLVDEHGPENVLLLAQSINNAKSPIRLVVNKMVEMKDASGRRMYNFHLRGGSRGFESRDDDEHKVRVSTFCAAKGCEADVVVVFGFDLYDPENPTALNQIGVALSRARQRLVVIHGRRSGDKLPLRPYPVSGAIDVADPGHSCAEEVVEVGSFRSPVPPAVVDRSALAGTLLAELQKQGVLKPYKDQDRVRQGHNMQVGFGAAARAKLEKEDKKERWYTAAEFTHFSAAAEGRFLAHGAWSDGRGAGSSNLKIAYEAVKQFEQTKEDVSAVYGNAVAYMLQWEMQGFCPHVEAVVSAKVLRFDQHVVYDWHGMVAAMVGELACEPMSEEEISLCERMLPARGRDVMTLFNTRVVLRKRRELADGRAVVFRVQAMLQGAETDELLRAHVPRLREAYARPRKTEGDWVYIANAVMAFGSYHEKFKQIGTERAAYAAWVGPDARALQQGLARLRALVAPRTRQSPLAGTGESSGSNADATRSRGGGLGGEFEAALEFRFASESALESPGSVIVGVVGVCDWVGSGLSSPAGQAVDLLEIKFVSELSNAHRLQTLIYCALLVTVRRERCAALLYNARTSEAEVCEVADVHSAVRLLEEVSRFKCHGV